MGGFKMAGMLQVLGLHWSSLGVADGDNRPRTHYSRTIFLNKAIYNKLLIKMYIYQPHIQIKNQSKMNHCYDNQLLSQVTCILDYKSYGYTVWYSYKIQIYKLLVFSYTCICYIKIKVIKSNLTTQNQSKKILQDNS